MTRSAHFSRDRSIFKDIPPAPEYIDTPPERVGLLSLTLAPSPAVKWILPARIRSRKHNDVVFIGSTYIQLREFHSNGQLSDATAKLDFGTQILGAKVISAKAETVPIQDQILGQEWEWEEERYIIKGKPCTDEQPPQIVVLVTASSELVYLYAKTSLDGKHIEFVYAKRALLQDVSLPDRHVRHMAIDPDCKILATSSYKSCTVFSLKDVDDLKETIDTWDPRRPQSFQPNIEQRMFQVDGHILKMDFLRASEDEPDKAILVLLVAKNKKTLLLLYRWNTQEPLDQMKPMSDLVQELPNTDHFPLMLIPSHKRRSFVIVTRTSAVFYDDISSLGGRRMDVALRIENQSDYEQLWVQWAKPSRHDGYSNQKEDILLVREDGLLVMLLRSHNPPTATAMNFSPGGVKIDVDSAVCMLPGPRLMGGDILIVGGSMSDGGVFHLRPREALYMLQIIPNVCPIHNVTTMNHVVGKSKNPTRLRTFVTAGVPGISSLNELRFGHEAQIGWTLPTADVETITGLWTLEDSISKRLFIIASHLEHTSAIFLDLQTNQFEEVDPDLSPALQFHTPTLAVEKLTTDLSIQISTNCVSVGFDTDEPATQVVQDCICATIDPISGTFALACRDETGYYMRIGLASKLEASPSILLSSAQFNIDDRPLCLAFQNFENGQFLYCGFSSGSVEVFSIDTEGHLAMICNWTPSEVNVSAITSLVLLGTTSGSSALLLAGTRAGHLNVLKAISAQHNSSNVIDLELDRVYLLGTTQVTVVKESNTSNGVQNALVMCGTRLDRVLNYSNGSTPDYMLVNVLLSTRNDLTYLPQRLNAVHRIRTLTSNPGGEPSDFLICASNEAILFAKLIEQEQIVPRRIAFSEKGARLMVYSKYLRRFIVASDRLRTNSFSLGQISSADSRPALHVVDAENITNTAGKQMSIVIGEPDEHVQVLLPWEPTDGKSHYNLIMVGLGNDKNSRLGLISASKFKPNPDEEGNTIIDTNIAAHKSMFKPLIKFSNKKIYSICAVEQSALAVCVGKEIVLMRLEFASKKWHEDARYRVPSPALSISAQGSVIYAATKEHSHIVLRWRRGLRKLETVLSDRVARNAECVLPYGKHGDHLLLATAIDQGTCILGYSISRNSEKATTPLFEAELPYQISHIEPVPTSWDENVQYAFQGLTYDGTVCIFQTLTVNEWKLLSFLVQLVQPDPAKTAKRQMSLLTEKLARNFLLPQHGERVAYVNPKRMHIRGDVLKRLVDQGPSFLRRLAGTEIKNEEDMVIDGEETPRTKLNSLARLVMGETDDLPAAVIAWTRKMLRATIF